ncbi:putative glycoside hydrolase [Anaerocolumna xylanovorans]|uniref:DUF4015 domain-containing protein n=1 Tax=Anaerocolumna xylanovorans DSM 12503 TaxID=1121345 RepID=A0A1M7YH81_9FIRM|nr:putative glycoside hydrolase [Anaerocolumna xylanovorans]SHO51878.1 hypothetical protein SAMN02745217_03381 [Anaerocolumna xylanovorans DSM 12503]
MKIMKKKDMYIRYHKNRDQRRRKKRKIIAGSTAAAVFLLFSSLFLLWHFHIVDMNSFMPDKKSKTEVHEENSSYNSGNKKEDTGIAEDVSADTLTPAEVFDSAQSPLTDNIKRTETKAEADITPDVAKEEKEVNEPVKGIYVSGFRAGISDYMSELISLAENTEINAMVIDIKNDNGEITYKMDQPLVNEIGAGTNYIKDMPGLVKKLKEKNIYLIARVVAFKDPLLAKERKDLCLKKKGGTVFKDKNGDRWVNPYKKEVWDYLVDIGKEAALQGFDEIQFDYIRFSTDSGMKQVDFGKDGKSKSKTETITEFTKYACDSLKPLGVKVSADVFGTIIGSKIDAEIVGQDYAKMAEYLDYICPMIYPSHYGEGSFGIDYPDTKPYETILGALKKSNEVLTADGKNDKGKLAEVRPWLQDFTATWVKHHINYGKEEIKEQIKAVYDTGHTEWILWNGSNNYTKTALEKK